MLLVTGTFIAYACPGCYGATENNTIEATNNAVVVMLGITGFVLVTFGAFFIYVWKRTRRIREKISHDSFIDQNGAVHLIQNKGMVEWKNS